MTQNSIGLQLSCMHPSRASILLCSLLIGELSRLGFLAGTTRCVGFEPVTVNFDYYEGGSPFDAGLGLGFGVDLGNPTQFPNGYFGLSFPPFFLATRNGNSNTQSGVITPSPPNFGFYYIPSTDARIQIQASQAAGCPQPRLQSLYIGYYVPTGSVVTLPATVSITGRFQGVLVPTCNYAKVFDGPNTDALKNLIFLGTPGCQGIDSFDIHDSTGQNLYLVDNIEFAG